MIGGDTESFRVNKLICVEVSILLVSHVSTAVLMVSSSTHHRVQLYRYYDTGLSMDKTRFYIIKTIISVNHSGKTFCSIQTICVTHKHI